MKYRSYIVTTEDASWSRLAMLWFGDPSLGWALFRYQVESHDWPYQTHRLEIGWKVNIPDWPTSELEHVVASVPADLITDDGVSVSANKYLPAETLFDVARHYYGTALFVSAIAVRNGKVVSSVKGGETLALPAVVPGNLYTLALQYQEVRGVR